MKRLLGIATLTVGCILASGCNGNTPLSDFLDRNGLTGLGRLGFFGSGGNFNRFSTPTFNTTVFGTANIRPGQSFGTNPNNVGLSSGTPQVAANTGNSLITPFAGMTAPVFNSVATPTFTTNAPNFTTPSPFTGLNSQSTGGITTLPPAVVTTPIVTTP